MICSLPTEDPFTYTVRFPERPAPPSAATEKLTLAERPLFATAVD
jgi:hypothetical protein